MGKDAPIVGLDVILQQLGAFGKYNIVNYALLLFPVYLAGMYGQAFVFEASNVDYRCKVSLCENNPNTTSWTKFAIPITKTGELSKCQRYAYRGPLDETSQCTEEMFDRNGQVDCTEFVYSDLNSAVVDFNLGCQDGKRTLIGTFRNCGLFLSLPLTGYISDKYGRKVALSVASLMNCIFGVLRSFSVNYYMMIAFEFLDSGLGAGAYSTAFVLAMELVGPKGRVFGNTLINVVFVCGLMSLAGISWLLQDWRNMLRIIYTPACLVFSYLWLLNESVRWLLSKGRNEEAVAILQKAAKINKVTLSQNDLDPLYETHALETRDEEKENVTKELPESKVNENEVSVFKRIITSRIIVRRLVSCSYLWVTCTFVYYGLSINSVSLAGNKYLNFMLVSFIEIPANLVCLSVLDRFGRKRVMISTYILSAILCMGLSFVPKGLPYLSLAVYLSGKFSITVAYSSVYIYVSEVFPTNVRQSLLAVCSTTGRIGSTLAPLTPLLQLYYENLPSIFFGTLAIVAGLLVFTLPETLNVPLPDTIEEAELLSRTKTNTP